MDAVALSPDSRTAAFSFDGGVLQIWDVEHARHIRTLNPTATTGIVAVKFSSDGSMLAAGCADGLLRMWDTSTWSMKTWPITGIITLEFLGDRIAIATRDTITMFSPVSEKTTTFNVVVDEDDNGSITRLAAHPDGRRLLVGRGRPSNLVSVWDASTGERKMVLRGHISPIAALAVSPEGRYAASGEADESDVILWDLTDGQRLRKMHNRGASIGDIKLTGLDQILCMGLNSGYVSRWAPGTTIALESPPDQAFAKLREQPQHGPALHEVGRWFLLRNTRPWAIDFLQQAQLAGEPVSSRALAEARWFWTLNDAAGALKDLGAVTPTDEDDAFRLRLLRSALQREVDKKKE